MAGYIKLLTEGLGMRYNYNMDTGRDNDNNIRRGGIPFGVKPIAGVQAIPSFSFLGEEGAV